VPRLRKGKGEERGPEGRGRRGDSEQKRRAREAGGGGEFWGLVQNSDHVRKTRKSVVSAYQRCSREVMKKQEKKKGRGGKNNKGRERS